MEGKKLRFPFEVEYSEMIQDMEPYVSAVFASLESDFMNMPRGAYGTVKRPILRSKTAAMRS